MSDGLDAAEFLDIDMDQFAWPLALVAHHRRLGFERRQLADPETPQHLAHRRHRHGELFGDRRAAQALPPQTPDRGNPRSRSAIPAALWRRAAVSQRRRSTAVVARQPVVGAASRQAAGLRRLRHRPALLREAFHHQEAALQRQPRILVQSIRAVSPTMAVSLATHSLTGFPGSTILVAVTPRCCSGPPLVRMIEHPDFRIAE